MHFNPKNLKGKRIEKFRISGFNVDGFPMGKFRGFPIIVRNALPGEILDIQIQLVRASFAEAIVEKYHNISDSRCDVPCEHFGICGGCNWMHLQYSQQLAQKMDNILFSFTVRNNIAPEFSHSIVPCSHLDFFRNKAEYTFSANRWFNPDEPKIINPAERLALGYHVPNWFEKVFDLHHCRVVMPIAERIRRFAKTLAVENQLSFYDFKTQRGSLKSLTIRTSSLNEVIVIFGFNAQEPLTQAHNEFLSNLWMNFPEIKSIFYTLHEQSKPITEYLELFPFGNSQPWFHENIEGLLFRIHAKSFFQTNIYQTPVLYRLIRQFAALNGHEVVYDLYCGTGTIGLYLAGSASEIIGIDHSASSIEDARWNASHNKIENARFFCGDIFEESQRDFFSSLPAPDVIILDPPRGGLKKGLVPKIMNLKASKIIYVSCNPVTQAWDLEQMLPSYHLIHMQAVDMFPHTHHVENICVLEKKPE